VPTDFCARVETAVGGEVTRKELRPDDWQEIWPELDAQSEKKTAATGAAEESNEELRREVDLGCRQPADPKKVSQ
jgi:DNA-binding transcriptional regulator YdaS (Cro superfamily)